MDHDLALKHIEQLLLGGGDDVEAAEVRDGVLFLLATGDRATGTYEVELQIKRAAYVT